MNETRFRILLIEDDGDEEIAVKAMKAGAYDYLIKDLEHHYLNVLPATTENVIKRKEIEKLMEARTAELIKTNEQLKASLKEKDVLLREVHHRVKNNLQVIYGLLETQSNQIKDKQTLDLYRGLQNMILSMALVHKTLYKSKELSRVDFKDYISNLVHILYKSFGVSVDRVVLNLHIDDVSLEITTAIYCGLMINELVSNSLKYAFPDDRKGEITISFKPRDKGEFELIIKDNGIGVPEDFDFKKADTCGLSMVRFFIDSMLEGKLEIKRDKGTQCIITFRV
jgi:two-component sensor histidine kinase